MNRPASAQGPAGAVARPKLGGRLLLVLAGILALRVLAGLSFALVAPGLPELYDGEDYRELAASVAGHRGFSISRVRWFEAPRAPEPTPEAFRPPLLPFLAGWLIDVRPDSFASLLVLQGILASLLAGVVALLLLDVAGPAAAWAGMALCTLHPLLLHYSTCFSTEILFTLCLAGYVRAWLWRSPWRWPAVGCAIALATLARPTAVLLLPASIVAILGSEPRRRWAAAGLVTTMFLATMSPWMIRNALVFGAPRLTGWYGGYIFWLGNNRHNLEAYRADSDGGLLRHQEDARAAGVRMAASLGPEYRHPGAQESFWLREAWRDIRGYGLRAWLSLLAGKAWQFWRPWPNRAAHAPGRFWPVAVTETALYIAGVAGLVFLWRESRAVLVPLALLLLVGTAAHSLTFAHLRHRVPFVDLAMLVGAGALAEPALGAWRRGAAATRPRASAARGPATG